jgi:hypothetical protein
MTSMAHLHPKTPEKSFEGGRYCTALRSMDDLVQYCGDCLDGKKTKCQHGRKKCEIRDIWQGHLAWIADQHRVAPTG